MILADERSLKDQFYLGMELQKSCTKRIQVVTDDTLYDRKAFCKLEIMFIHPL